MKRAILGGLLGGAALAGSNALATDDTGSWYVSPMAQYTFLDSGRHSKDTVGYAFAFGQNFAPGWAAELNASIGSFKIANSGASQQFRRGQQILVVTVAPHGYHVGMLDDQKLVSDFTALSLFHQFALPFERRLVPKETQVL